jgi:hypothetical protein
MPTVLLLAPRQILLDSPADHRGAADGQSGALGLGLGHCVQPGD